MPKVPVLDIQQQEKAVDFIRDWCKWLIGLSFTSGIGCVTVLQQGVSSSIKVYLAAAIFFFAVTSIVSVIMVAVLPLVMQHLPLVSKSGKFRNIYDFRVLTNAISIKSLTILQLILFAIGLACIFTWVILKPAV